MNITFDELRSIKHRLPTGSVNKIAELLSLNEQTIRNYFGAKKFDKGNTVDMHIQPGPGGGIVHLEDLSILNAAKNILMNTDSNN